MSLLTRGISQVTAAAKARMSERAARNFPHSGRTPWGTKVRADPYPNREINEIKNAAGIAALGHLIHVAPQSECYIMSPACCLLRSLSCLGGSWGKSRGASLRFGYSQAMAYARDHKIPGRIPDLRRPPCACDEVRQVFGTTQPLVAELKSAHGQSTAADLTSPKMGWQSGHFFM
jgi:hypothetical protein